MFNNLLANNTCDLEEDIKNNRKTLVYYLGKKRAVYLLLALTAFNYLWLALLVITHLAPISVLILYLTLPIITKSLKKYATLQDKKTTFPLVLKSMSMMMVFYPILYFLGSFL
jgi:1,4-dihydroxy-2-naphthoate octaprenyltransferase